MSRTSLTLDRRGFIAAVGSICATAAGWSAPIERARDSTPPVVGRAASHKSETVQFVRGPDGCVRLRTGEFCAVFVS